jgi:hypothetical protein
MAQVPLARPTPPAPGDPAYSIYPGQDKSDWATRPGTVVEYGGILVNQAGGVNVRPAAATPEAGLRVDRGAAPTIAVGAAASTPSAAKDLVVVGTHGLSPANLAALAQNVAARSALPAPPGAGSTGGEE